MLVLNTVSFAGDALAGRGDVGERLLAKGLARGAFLDGRARQTD